MNKEELRQKLGKLCIGTQKDLNNISIWTSFSKQALDAAISEPSFLSQEMFRVPSLKKNKKIKRPTEELKTIARQATAEINISTFVYAIAKVEACMIDMLFEVLWFDELTKNLNTNNSNKVDTNLSERLRERLDKKMRGAKSQLNFYQEVMEVNLRPETIGQWCEIKATRNALVHYSGKAIEKYTKEAGVLARVPEGQLLPIDEEYFTNSLIVMKHLIGRSHTMRNKLKKGR